jgi:hypothetical protein
MRVRVASHRSVRARQLWDEYNGQTEWSFCRAQKRILASDLSGIDAGGNAGGIVGAKLALVMGERCHSQTLRGSGSFEAM